MNPDELTTPAGFVAWRESYGLSQSALARLLHVNNQTVWRWEHGTREIPYTTALALLYLATTLRRKPRRAA